MKLKDFRGNAYKYCDGLEVRCDEPDCENEAVRLPCNVHRHDRTHWHGGIHRLDSGAGTLFCETHGLQHLAENQAIIERTNHES